MEKTRRQPQLSFANQAKYFGGWKFMIMASAENVSSTGNPEMLLTDPEHDNQHLPKSERSVAAVKRSSAVRELIVSSIDLADLPLTTTAAQCRNFSEMAVGNDERFKCETSFINLETQQQVARIETAKSLSSLMSTETRLQLDEDRPGLVSQVLNIIAAYETASDRNRLYSAANFNSKSFVSTHPKHRNNSFGKREHSKSAQTGFNRKNSRQCRLCGKNHSTDMCYKLNQAVALFKSNEKETIRHKKATNYRGQNPEYTPNQSFTAALETNTSHDADDDEALNEETPSYSFMVKSAMALSPLSNALTSDNKIVSKLIEDTSRYAVMDTGATSTFLSNKSLFSTYQKVNTAEWIGVASQTPPSPIIGKGTFEVMPGIHIPAAHAPNFRVNLISVKELMENVPNTFFSGNKTTFNIMRHGKSEPLLKATIIGGMWLLDIAAQHNAKLAILNAANAENHINSALAVHPKSRARVPNMRLLHTRLGHPGPKAANMVRLHSSKYGLTNQPTGAAIRTQDCVNCGQAKIATANAPNNVRRASKPYEVIHCDIMDPFPKGYGGKQYVILMTDDNTCMRHSETLRTKSGATGFILFMLKHFARKGHIVQVLHTDGARELSASNHIVNYCTNNGIELDPSVPYDHVSNARAERSNRIIQVTTMALRLHAKCPEYLWPFAIQMAVYLDQRTPRPMLDNKSPIEVATGQTPNLSNLRVPFCKAVVLRPKEIRQNKLTPHGQICVFVGYAKRGWIFLNIETNKMLTSRSVTWYEESFPKSNIGNQQKEPLMENSEDVPVPLSRPKRTAKPIQRFDDIEYDNSGYQIPHTALKASVSRPQDITYIPTSQKDSRMTPFSREWAAAEAEENAGLHERKTLTPVYANNLHSRARFLPLKYVYNIKSDENGNILRRKARLVLGGHMQRPGIDYTNSYAPVACTSLFRIMLSIAALNDYIIEWWDVKQAYLHGRCDVPHLYAKAPNGFLSHQQIRDGYKLLHVQGNLYGSCSAGKVWYDFFVDIMKQIGIKLAKIKVDFKQLDTDSCSFIFRRNQDEFLIILVHVDDCLTTSDKVGNLLQLVRNNLTNRGIVLKIKRDATKALGMHITRDRIKRTVTLFQHSFVQDLLLRFDHDNMKTSKSPMRGRTNILDIPVRSENEKAPEVPYRQLLGGLTWLATSSRPDIAFVVNTMAQYSNNFTQSHFNILLHILSYLKGSSNKGLVLGGNEAQVRPDYVTHRRNAMHAFVDASDNELNFRSRSGILIKIGAGCVFWKSKKERLAVSSSTEAEYIALYKCAREIVYLRQFLEEIGYLGPDPTSIYEDNNAALLIATGRVNNGNSKAIRRKYHVIRDWINDNFIRVSRVDTHQQKADGLTKLQDDTTQFNNCSDVFSVK